MEPIGELVSERLDDDVIVIRHQAEDVDKPVVPHNDVCEEREKETAVVVGSEDRRSLDAARSDMVGAVGEDVARKAAHSDTVGPPIAITCREEPSLWTKSHTFVAVAMSARGSSWGLSSGTATRVPVRPGRVVRARPPPPL